MTISEVSGQGGGVSVASGSSSLSRAYPSDVSVGSLLTIVASELSRSTPFVVGNCTKTAGTAEIGPIWLDVAKTHSTASTSSGVWSCVVTKGGSCTLTVNTQAMGAISVSTQETRGQWSDARGAGVNSADFSFPTTHISTGAVAAPANSYFVGVLATAVGSVSITQDPAWSLIYELQSGTVDAGISHISKITAAGGTFDANWDYSIATAATVSAMAVYAEVPPTTIGQFDPELRLAAWF